MQYKLAILECIIRPIFVKATIAVTPELENLSRIPVDHLPASVNGSEPNESEEQREESSNHNSNRCVDP